MLKLSQTYISNYFTAETQEVLIEEKGKRNQTETWFPNMRCPNVNR